MDVAGGLVRASRGNHTTSGRLRVLGIHVQPLQEPQGGAGSQHRRVDVSQTRPASCPSAPHRPRAGPEKRLSAGFVSQGAVSFLDEPSRSGDAPGYGGQLCPAAQPGPHTPRAKQDSGRSRAGRGSVGPANAETGLQQGLHLPRAAASLQGQAHSVPTSWR